MTRQEIMDNYAKEENFVDWNDLENYCMIKGGLQYHYNEVIDLIQEELKKEIKNKMKTKILEFLYEDEDEKTLHIGYYSSCDVTEEWNHYLNELIDTPNI